MAFGLAPALEAPYETALSFRDRAHIVTAVQYCMKVVQRYQLQRCTDPLGKKADGTLTALSADKASEAAGKDILRRIPGIQIHGEETGQEGVESDVVVCLDALDGSMPYAVGAGTSTVIAAAYSRKNREVFYCVVGNPQTGQVWKADKGRPTFVTIYGPGPDEPMSICSVSTEPISSRTRVFIDSYPGFTRCCRTILSRPELNRLEGLIDERSGRLLFGSNGFHHAHVAHGGKAAVGAITTAIGGWWDVCPVLLVTRAGGCATAFQVESDGKLTECNPLDVMSYDILITANNQATLDVLVEAVKKAKGQ